LPDVRRLGIALAMFNTVGTVGFIAVATSGLLPLTGAGVAVTLACSVYTAVFAVLQYLGVRRLA
jgi:hypothetical protein